MLIHYGKEGRCRATIRTAKGLVCTAKTLPCADARQRPPGNASDGNGTIAVRVDNLHGKGRCRACAGLPCGRLFAVRADFAVRALGCRARYHCRAACSLPCAHSLPCVRAVSCDTLCRAPACKAARQSPLQARLQGLPGAQVSATWPLCRACAHGKVTKSPLPCAYARQRPLVFSFFFCFSLIPAFQKLHFTYITYTTYIFTIASPNTSRTPQIHQHT
jgi:hypothetical protein